MTTFMIAECTDELKRTLAHLAQLNKTTLSVRQVVVVETDPSLASLLKVLLGTLVVDPTAQTPASPAPTAIEARICLACQLPYQPVRKDQRYCTRAECKADRKRADAQMRYQGAKQADGEVPTETSPFVWEILSGPYQGQRYTPAGLNPMLAMMQEDTQLMHTSKGLHHLVRRKGRAGLVPEAVPPSATGPSEPIQS
jgi:hypothetical protein